MKVIGQVNDRRLICSIQTDEICRIFNHSSSYSCGGDFKAKLNVGKEIDLGLGYNFKQEIKSLCKDMKKLNDSFISTNATLQRFADMVLSQEESDE